MPSPYAPSDPLDLVLLATLGRKLDAQTLAALHARNLLPGMPSRDGATTLLSAWLSARSRSHGLPVKFAAPGPAAPFGHAGPGQPPWPPCRSTDKRDQEEDFAAHLWRLATEGAGESLPTLPEVLSRLWQQALFEGWRTLATQMLAEDAVFAARLSAHPAPMGPCDPAKAMPWPHALAWLGYDDVLSAWLDACPSAATSCDADSRTPLFFATTPAIATALMAAGASPDHQDAAGKTPLGAWSSPPFNAIPASVREQVARVRGENPGDRMLAWCNAAPPETTDTQTLRAMEAWRITTPDAQGRPREWGPLAWMARNLRRTFYDNTARAAVEKRVAGWKAFTAALPQSWLMHESVPGLADGWLWQVAWQGMVSSTRLAAEIPDILEKMLPPDLDATTVSPWRVHASAELLGASPFALDWLTSINAAPIIKRHALEITTCVLEHPALAAAWLGGQRPSLGRMRDLLSVEVSELSPSNCDQAWVTRFWNAALALPATLHRRAGPGMQEIVFDNLEQLAKAGLWPDSLESRHARKRLRALAVRDDGQSFNKATAEAVRVWLDATEAATALVPAPSRAPVRPRRRA